MDAGLKDASFNLPCWFNFKLINEQENNTRGVVINEEIAEIENEGCTATAP